MSYASIGLISLIIDTIIYIFLSDFLMLSESKSKIISFMAASLNSFIGNKIFTFKIKKYNLNEPVKFVLLYSVSLFANSFIHDFFLNIFGGLLPFFLASMVSVLINFNGQKFWVYNYKKNSNDSNF